MSSVLNRFAGASRVVTALVVLFLVLAFIVMFRQGDPSKKVTVNFAQTNSLYKGSEVKILGVPVGKVTEITPRGESVRVTIEYKGNIKLPDDVKAIVVSPSIVGDRYVQLAPAYSGGTVLADNASLGIDRTAVPVELDQIYKSLDDLAVALGPNGANKNGALGDLVKNSASQLKGQGAQLNETLRNFGKLSTTLSNNKEALFSSMSEVNDFVSLLQRNDESVRGFFDSTAKVSQVLDGEREDLAKTLKSLSLALIDVRDLVKENRSSLRSNVKNLTQVATVLGNHVDDINAFTVNAPTALSNVALTYNGDSGTLDNRADLVELLGGALDAPGSVVCSALSDFIDADQCNQLGGILDGILPDLGAGVPDVGGLPRTAAASSPDPMLDSVSDMLAVK